MKKIIPGICLLVCFSAVNAQNSAGKRSIPFDAGWHFIKDSTVSADAAGYDDSKWKIVNLPHDWSIEDLPNQTPDSIIGPFRQKQYRAIRNRIYCGRNRLVQKEIYYCKSR